MNFDVLKKFSPNFNERKNVSDIDIIILHYTVINQDLTLKTFADPGSKVSSHYLINNNGNIIQIVPDEKRAWHAGKSFWAGETDINSRSIGIEIVNDGNSNYKSIQIEAVINLCAALRDKYNIPNARILGHSDVAPARKNDPGKFFPWEDLAIEGVGIYPFNLIDENDNKTIEEKLAKIGYDVSPKILPFSIKAFKSHYAPFLLEIDDDEPALISYLDSVINLI